MTYFTIVSLLGIGFLLVAFLLSAIVSLLLSFTAKPYDPNADYSDSEGE